MGRRRARGARPARSAHPARRPPLFTPAGADDRPPRAPTRYRSPHDPASLTPHSPRLPLQSYDAAALQPAENAARILQMRVREPEAQCAQLEAERASLTTRANSAEEQLATLQAAMSSQIAMYQNTILKLRDRAEKAEKAAAAARGASNAASPQRGRSFR